MSNYIITIARGFGSGGKYIGRKLGERLGIPCYEREILTMASEKSGISESIFARTDEKLRGTLLLNELKAIPSEVSVSPEDKKFVSDSNLFAIQSEVIKTLAKTQSCIIIGKCADYVLRDQSNVLSIYVDAPRKACVDSIIEKMNVTEKEANRLIERTDKYRSEYYKYYTGGRDWVNPTNYHIFLNSDKVGRDNCVDIIEAIAKLRFHI
jgi:hypothetical protein